MNVEGRNQKNSLGSRRSMQGNMRSTPALKEETFNPLTLCSRGLSCCSQCTQVWHTEASHAMHQTMCAHLLQPVPPCSCGGALCPTHLLQPVPPCPCGDALCPAHLLQPVPPCPCGDALCPTHLLQPVPPCSCGDALCPTHLLHPVPPCPCGDTICPTHLLQPVPPCPCGDALCRYSAQHSH